MSHRNLSKHGLPDQNDVTSAETQRFLEETMAEHGVEPDGVTIYTEESMKPSRNSTMTIMAKKEINGEMLKAQTVISTTDQHDADKVQSEIALAGRKLASYFEEEMYHYIDIANTRLEVCSAQGGWARCTTCDREVALTDLVREMTTFEASAEFSNPSPSPYDIQDFLQKVDESSEEVLKFYLLGALRKHCHCGFGHRKT
jgi:hypothetical protein